MWWMWFQAFAVASRFKPAIGRTIGPKMPASDTEVLDLTTPTGKDAVKAKKQNELVVAYLTMVFQADHMIGMGSASIDGDWPRGLAY